MIFNLRNYLFPIKQSLKINSLNNFKYLYLYFKYACRTMNKIKKTFFNLILVISFPRKN